ncbi:hypothetical protein FZD47_20265 [Bacillus infantis]|uniref:Uncharacterized protein n=1 Tax=Bacillus infantis TaxID=324767 RepID=A0A5D4SC48_9BACI|nr:hypothetical protein [Bacillus infantis]TYS60549.1 hypothetical protein FZD47_20265 [Bacillus infantis]
MHSALLQDGTLVAAAEYQVERHGSSIHCIDQTCLTPVIFIAGTENTVAYFKTSGKGNSVHKPSCGFFQKLTFEQSISKVTQFQQAFKDQGIQDVLVRLNLNAIDPDYVPKPMEREPKEKALEEKSFKIKNENETPQSISSLKAIKKLITNYEPDILASIVLSIKGQRVAISELIKAEADAHAKLWAGELNSNLPYFIHGKIEKITRREKVWYISLSTSFSLVIFDKYFKHFTYKDKQLLDKEILAYGFLKKNTYSKERQSSEIIY